MLLNKVAIKTLDHKNNWISWILFHVNRQTRLMFVCWNVFVSMRSQWLTLDPFFLSSCCFTHVYTLARSHGWLWFWHFLCLYLNLFMIYYFCKQLVRMEWSGYSSWMMLQVKVSSMNVKYLDAYPLMLMLFGPFQLIKCCHFTQISEN